MATLKISDLSVGDWVKVKKCAYFPLDKPNNFISNYAKITAIEDENCTIWLKTNVGEFCASLKNVEPIPITAEILEKNGFEKGHRGCFYHYLRLDKNRTLYIHASTNGWRVEITYDAAGILRTTHLMPDIDSVHQLQHALRLAGVDKEINL